MRFRDTFHRILRPLELFLWVVTVISFLYGLAVEGKWSWHSGPHVAALATAVALAMLAMGLRELRKRWHAGIFHFAFKHSARDAGTYIRTVETDYLYLGQSFKSTIDEFMGRRGRGGMAANARTRLLLADPDDPHLMGFLGEIHVPPMDANGMKRDLCERIVHTLEQLEGVSRLNVRTHREKIRCWLHLFDKQTMIFGLLPQGASGEIAPAMNLEPVRNRWTLFNHLEDWVERVWAQGVEREPKSWLLKLKQELEDSNQGLTIKRSGLEP
jgi:hypothetical protein